MELDSSQAKVEKADSSCGAEGVEGWEFVWYFGIREASLGPFPSSVVRADAWQSGTNIEELGRRKHIATSLYMEGASGTNTSTGRPIGRIPVRGS